MKIKDVCEKYEVLILHATKYGGGAGFFFGVENNDFIKKDAPVHQRIMKAATVKNAISCSSFKHIDKTFAPIGIILSDGEITMAGPHDLGTVISNEFDRVSLEPENFISSIGEQVDNAILNKQGYNEIIVKNCKALGIFLRTEDINYLYEEMSRNYAEFYNGTKALGLPYFIIEGSCIYNASFCSNQKSFIKISDISLTEIIRQMEQ